MGNLSTFIDRGVSLLAHTEPPVIITGFWRSGTTFLQDLTCQTLGAKPVFEPLYKSSPDYLKYLKARVPPGVDPLPFFNFFMPWAPEDGDPDRLLARFLDGVIAGRRPTKWTCHTRNNMAKQLGYGGWQRIYAKSKISLRKRLVVKFVRGHLLIPYIKHRFGLPIIHIQRNPLEIARSFIKAGWHYPGSMDDINLRSLLLDPSDRRSEFFAPYSRLIDQSPQFSGVKRLALYWGLCEKFVQSHAHGITIINYHELVRRPHATLRTALAPLFREDELHLERIRPELASATVRAATPAPAQTRIGAVGPANDGDENIEATLKEIGVTIPLVAHDPVPVIRSNAQPW